MQLIRLHSAIAVGCALLVGVALLGVPTVAFADPPPVKCYYRSFCELKAEQPAQPSSTGTPVVTPAPLVDCHDPAVCPDEVVADVAQRAIRLLRLRGALIGRAPAAGGSGLVGLPVWLWTAVTPQTWGPIARTAAVDGLAVTARAQARAITWEMGDGGRVECGSPGTPYDRSYGNAGSPDCGYVYARASTGLPGGVYSVTATTSWVITWREVGGGGRTGTLATTTQSQTTVAIGELQVLAR